MKFRNVKKAYLSDLIPDDVAEQYEKDLQKLVGELQSKKERGIRDDINNLLLEREMLKIRLQLDF